MFLYQRVCSPISSKYIISICEKEWQSQFKADLTNKDISSPQYQVIKETKETFY